MPEIFSIALSGVNIIPTTFLAVAMFYWLFVIIGGLDIDIFGFDIDFDVDAEGIFVDILSFLKINNVPITIYLTTVLIFQWFFLMLFAINTGINGGILGWGALILLTIFSLILTSYITLPFKSLFKDIGGKSLENSETLVGKGCVLKYDLNGNEVSQAIIDDKDGKILVSVKKFNNCIDIKKGQSALIIDEEKNKNIYLIEPFNENEWE